MLRKIYKPELKRMLKEDPTNERLEDALNKRCNLYELTSKNEQKGKKRACKGQG